MEALRGHAVSLSADVASLTQDLSTMSTSMQHVLPGLSLWSAQQAERHAAVAAPLAALRGDVRRAAAAADASSLARHLRSLVATLSQAQTLLTLSDPASSLSLLQGLKLDPAFASLAQVVGGEQEVARVAEVERGIVQQARSMMLTLLSATSSSQQHHRRDADQHREPNVRHVDEWAEVRAAYRVVVALSVSPVELRPLVRAVRDAMAVRVASQLHAVRQGNEVGENATVAPPVVPVAVDRGSSSTRLPQHLTLPDDDDDDLAPLVLRLPDPLHPPLDPSHFTALCVSLSLSLPAHMATVHSLSEALRTVLAERADAHADTELLTSSRALLSSLPRTAASTCLDTLACVASRLVTSQVLTLTQAVRATVAASSVESVLADSLASSSLTAAATLALRPSLTAAVTLCLSDAESLISFSEKEERWRGGEWGREGERAVSWLVGVRADDGAWEEGEAWHFLTPRAVDDVDEARSTSDDKAATTTTGGLVDTGEAAAAARAVDSHRLLRLLLVECQSLVCPTTRLLLIHCLPLVSLAYFLPTAALSSCPRRLSLLLSLHTRLITSRFLSTSTSSTFSLRQLLMAIASHFLTATFATALRRRLTPLFTTYSLPLSLLDPLLHAASSADDASQQSADVAVRLGDENIRAAVKAAENVQVSAAVTAWAARLTARDSSVSLDALPPAATGPAFFEQIGKVVLSMVVKVRRHGVPSMVDRLTDRIVQHALAQTLQLVRRRFASLSVAQCATLSAAVAVLRRKLVQEMGSPLDDLAADSEVLAARARCLVGRSGPLAWSYLEDGLWQHFGHGEHWTWLKEQQAPL